MLNFTPIKVTPVNIIAGFLGVGKTSIIQSLLKRKPRDEKWAVIVNEFGAVGIDAATLSSNNNDDNATGFTIKEVNGGCICCTGALEMHKAVVEILRTQKPDRLIIEPSGLGQIEKIVDMLREEPLGRSIQVASIFCAIDSTQYTPQRIEASMLHLDLLQMADYLVFTKRDIASKAAINALQTWAKDTLYPAKTDMFTIEQGELPIEKLDTVSDRGFKPIIKKTTMHRQNAQPIHSLPSSAIDQQTQAESLEHQYPHAYRTLPGLEEVKENKGFGSQSRGWILAPDVCFAWPKIQKLFDQLNHITGIKRGKAVARIGKLWQSFQWVNGQSSRDVVSYRRDSRFEFIFDDHIQPDWAWLEKQIANCIKSKAENQ